MRRAALLIMFAAAPLFAQQGRIASDFEIAQMKQQVAKSQSFLAQLSGHLNLGDLYLSRSERATARAEYARSLELASAERVSARRASDITRYATATSYAALALAKLGRGPESFAMLEEAMRYSPDSAKSWNLYASCMTVLGRTSKAVSAARNAVTIAGHDLEETPSVANRLDLGVYQYSLASALVEQGDREAAEELLRRVTTELEGNEFSGLRRQIRGGESFEIYSSARGDEAAYLSLANRAGLRLASVLEERGATHEAKAEYRRVLAMRTDDVTALTAMARLTPPGGERERYFAAAFDANPFSLPLIRAYQEQIEERANQDVDDSTPGGKVRHILVEMARGETRAARLALDQLLESHPGNLTLQALLRETEGNSEVPAFLTARSSAVIVAAEADLQRLIALFSNDKLTPDQRAVLDSLAFVNETVFDSEGAASAPGQTVFARGSIGRVRIKFAEPTAFSGIFAAGAPLRLTYRILGATELDGADALLVEPVKLEMAR